MASSDNSEQSLKEQINALDDKIELLVASLDEGAPDTHAEVYGEIERIHALIFTLREQLRQVESK